MQPVVCLKVERKEPGEQYRIENEGEQSHEDGVEMLQSKSQKTEQEKKSLQKMGMEGGVKGWESSESGEFCCAFWSESNVKGK